MAWGYLLLNLNFNFGTLNLLPNWLGYLLILSVFSVIAEVEASIKLLRPFAILLILWEGILWTANLVGFSFDGGIIGMLASVIELYFHFQLLTNLANVAMKYGCPEWKGLLSLRKIQTILLAFLLLPITWEKIEILTILVVIIQAIVSFLICLTLFSICTSMKQIGFEENTKEE